MDEFFTKTKCDRCGGSLAGGRTMSRFDTACICMECAAAEKNHPAYAKAVEAERDAISRGDYNFPGIGFPKVPEK